MPLHMHQSGRKLEPLAQYSLHQQLQKAPTQPTEETIRQPRRRESATPSDLDPPDFAMYQLRQKNNATELLAPHPQFELKSRQSQFSNNSMNLP